MELADGFQSKNPFPLTTAGASSSLLLHYPVFLLGSELTQPFPSKSSDDKQELRRWNILSTNGKLKGKFELELMDPSLTFEYRREGFLRGIDVVQYGHRSRVPF